MSALAGCAGQSAPSPTGVETVQSKSEASAEAEVAASQSPSAAAVVETPAPAPEPDQQAALAQAVVDYTNAYFEADWDTAYTRLWSERCKADNEARNSFIGTIAAQKVNYPDANKPRAGEVTETRIEGAVGLVTYSYTFNGQSQVIENQPWVLEGGAWHFDDC